MECFYEQPRRCAVSVTLRQVAVGSGFSEPLFCTVAVHDCAARAKVTEDWHVHANSARALAAAGLATDALPTLIRRAKFCVAPRAGLCLVAKLFRVFHGDAERDLLALQKGRYDSAAAAEAELKAAITGSGNTAPLALQPVFWTAVPLFVEGTGTGTGTGSRTAGLVLNENARAEGVVPVRGVLTDDALYDTLAGDPDRVRKIKTVPALLELALRGAGDAGERTATYDAGLVPSARLSAAGDPAVPYPSAKWLQAFDEEPLPCADCASTMYVYPESLSVKHGAGATPSIQVSAQLVLAEPLAIGQTRAFAAAYPPLYSEQPSPSATGDGEGEGLDSSTGSNSTGLRPAAMACEAFGAVQYGEARPQFGDELKLCLPLNLERVYLLFTFYNVAPKGKRTILGFAAIDLYGRNSAGAPMLLRNGLYHLPVVLALYEIPKGAARPLSAADCKKTKHTFSFRVRTLSSVFSQDVSIAALLYEDFSAIGQQQQQPLQQQQQPLHQGKTIGNGGNARQCLLLDSVSQRASAEELSRFFVPVMESLLDALYYCDLETSVHAFTAMLGVLRRLYELPLYQREGDTLLETYAEVLFDPSVYDTDNDGSAHRNATGLPLHDVLAQHWQNLAREGRLPGDTSANWFLQLLIAKAAQHYALRHGPAVSKTFEQNVCQAVRVLMSLYLTQAKMTPKNMKLLTKNIGSLADFVNAMMLVVDCSQLLSTVSVVLATMDGNNTDVRCASIVKVPFMRRFADYEHFVPLCCPVAFAPGAVESADTLEHALMHKYPPVGMLLREVSVSLAQRTHAYTVTFLLALLRKHDVDARYGAPAVRRRVATMYLPVVLDVLTQAETVGRADFGDELRHSLHLCVLWVLRDCDARVVRAWLQKETELRRTRFFELLGACLADFGAKPQQQCAVAVACRYARDFAVALGDTVRGAKDPVFERLFDAASTALAMCTEQTLQGVVDTLGVLLHRLPEHFFVHTGNAFLATLAGQLMHAASCRAQALSDDGVEQLAAVFRLMLALDFRQPRPDARRMRTQTALGMSQLVGANGRRSSTSSGGGNGSSNGALDAQRLTDFFQTVLDGLAGDALCAYAGDVVARLRQILEYHQRITRTSDPDTLAELYYKTILGYDDSPDLRITWLKNLAVKQKEFRNYEEAAQCYIFTAIMMSDYLARVFHVPIAPADFATLTPNVSCPITDLAVKQHRVRQQGSTSSGGNTQQQQQQLQSGMWSLDALVELLQQACATLREGWFYEHCIEIESLLTSIWKRERNYRMMQETLRQTTETCDLIIRKEKEREQQLFARYYYVAFFTGTNTAGAQPSPAPASPAQEERGRSDEGAGASESGRSHETRSQCSSSSSSLFSLLEEDVSDAEFIVKRPPNAVLSVVQKQMRESLAARVDGDASRVVLLPNNETVDKTKLDADKVYFQMCSATPFVDTDSESENGSNNSTHTGGTSYDRHFGARRFMSVQAFTEYGKKAQTQSLAEQRKKKTIYTTELAFPFVKSRIRVCEKVEIVLEPLENAIELVTERCAAMVEQLESTPVRLNPLQQVLQGSVAPMVNEGPLKICELFLEPGARAQQRPALVQKLLLALSNFVELCAALLEVNRENIKPNQQGFHAMLAKYFADLCPKALAYLHDQNVRLPKYPYTADDVEHKAWRELPRVSLHFDTRK